MAAALGCPPPITKAATAKMRLPTQRRPTARRRPKFTASSLLALAALAPTLSHAITVTEAPPANIDFSQLGRIGVAGDFSGVSLYQYQGQNERPFSTNGSEALLTQLPNGAFASLVPTDASIHSMCTFTMQNGNVAGIVIGGNFTSLDGSKSQAIAMINPDTAEVTPLDGLEGQVHALLCDRDTNTVYVGGNFRGANSTNAIAWYGTDGWTNLPFSGFNGPVTTITRASNGHIIFGGRFTGLGNTSSPSTPDGQIINLSTATITAGSSSSRAGFSDPKNIVCKTSGVDGAGNTWLLQDNTAGFWQARFNFGFQPTKIRLWNTRQDGRGTKTWRFTALPLNGILNLTYVDPATGQNTSCTNQCPLSNDPKVPFQDFHFVNTIGMDAFRIDISEFYGSGGGLNGIQLYEDDIFAYAINDFNEPKCAATTTPSGATSTGPWAQSASLESSSKFLTARLSSPITERSASVVFLPNIKESGNYSVNMYTPGCRQDNSCSLRGQVSITGVMSRDNKVSFSTSLYQTNNFDKYDQIYFGYIDASSTSFRPSVTLTPLAGQSLQQMTIVAHRVGFTLINSTGGLNGLFDFDPKDATIDENDFKSSAVTRLGSDFSGGSSVAALASSGDVTYIGGDFTSSNEQNIIGVNTNTAQVVTLGGGLNGEVLSMQFEGPSLYVGGEFSNTRNNAVQGLNNVAVYDTGKNSWSGLGAGVNGKVMHVVPIKLAFTKDKPETVITFTGDFSEVRAFGGNKAAPAAGFAVWVPSRNNWLQNLGGPVPSYAGILTAAILDLPGGGGSLFAGSLSSSQVSANGAVTLSSGDLGAFPIKIQTKAPSASQQQRRDLLSNGEVSGVVTGTFYEKEGRNITVLAGHFTAEMPNGTTINNLLIIDGGDEDAVSGLGPQIQDRSTFVAVAVQGDLLFAGGRINGTVNNAPVSGLVTYNIASRAYPTQPPALSGGNSTVSAILVRPNTGNIYVGGSFDQAGSLPCPGVCMYSTNQSQWNQPGVNLKGSVSTMMWASDTVLVAGGQLTVNDTAKTPLAIYDVNRQSWDSYPSSNSLPGPVEVITLGSSDGKQVWAAGRNSDGSVYIMKYDGSSWRATPQRLGSKTVIKSLQVFSLTSKHASTDLLPERQSLVITGSVDLSDFGTASAAIFDGTSFQPYALTTNIGNSAGAVSKIFTLNQDFFKLSGGEMPLVFVVLIGLAISLGLILLLVLAGILLDRLRKKREGYVPAPTSMYDRAGGVRRIPPGELLQSLGKGRAGAPHV